MLHDSDLRRPGAGIVRATTLLGGFLINPVVWTVLKRHWRALCQHLAAQGIDRTNPLALRYAA